MNEKSAWDEEKILVVLQTTEFSLVSGRASMRGIQKSEARLFIVLKLSSFSFSLIFDELKIHHVCYSICGTQISPRRHQRTKR